MNRLWQRNVSVTLGIKGTSEAVKLSGLRIVFQVEKTSESNPNTAKISVYNLSPDSRAMVEEENAYVLLEVGYGQETDQLFYGDITRAYAARQGADWVTTMESGDGDTATRLAHVDKSYAPGTDLKQVIMDVANSFKEQAGVVIGSITGAKSEAAQTGIALSGKSKTVLDQLTEKQRLEWSIQNNELQILPRDKDTGEEAALLTPDTGLIGSPIRREAAEKPGIEFKALIQTTRLIPGRLVSIQSRELSGTYKIKTAKFAGDTHGQTFYAMCQAEAI